MRHCAHISFYQEGVEGADEGVDRTKTAMIPSSGLLSRGPKVDELVW